MLSDSTRAYLPDRIDILKKHGYPKTKMTPLALLKPVAGHHVHRHQSKSDQPAESRRAQELLAPLLKACVGLGWEERG